MSRAYTGDRAAIKAPWTKSAGILVPSNVKSRVAHASVTTVHLKPKSKAARVVASTQKWLIAPQMIRWLIFADCSSFSRFVSRKLFGKCFLITFSDPKGFSSALISTPIVFGTKKAAPSWMEKC